MRQRDAWIETTFGGHIPVKILVSCKYKTRKLSQQDVDAFIGELRSSAANKGVIYSFNGFSKGALSKAEKLGIACCLLFENGASPEIPGILGFSSYCFLESLQLLASRKLPNARVDLGHLISLQIDYQGRRTPVSEILEFLYEEQRPKNIALKDGCPQPWCAELVITPKNGDEPLTLRLQTVWKAYRGRNDAYLVNGSYSFENGAFQGSISTPIVDSWGQHPGPGWEEIESGQVLPGGLFASFILKRNGVGAALRAYFQAQ